jgi:tetratricopeptide (TPR) repeat protein
MNFENPEDNKVEFSKERMNRIIGIVFAIFISIGIILSICYELDLLPVSVTSQKKEIERQINKKRFFSFDKIFSADLAEEISYDEPLREEIKTADSLFDKKKYKEAYDLYEEVYKKASEYKNNKLIGISLIGMAISVSPEDNYYRNLELLEESKKYLVYMDSSLQFKLFDNFAFCHIERKNYILAVEYLNKAIELSLQDAIGYIHRGVVYSRMGEYDLAIKDYNKAIEIDPDNDKIYNNRGIIHFRRHNFTLAIQDYSKAINMNLENAPAYYNLGNVYEAQRQYDKAIENYSKALELNPELAEAYCNRGAIYCSRKDYDLAIQDFNKALDLKPELTQAYLNRGRVYLAKGEYNPAIADFDKALELNPEYKEAYFNKGYTYSAKGEYDSAILNFDKVLEIDPKYYEAYFNKTYIYEILGKKREAIESYKAFLDLVPPQYEEKIRFAKERIKELEKELEQSK